MYIYNIYIYTFYCDQISLEIHQNIIFLSFFCLLFGWCAGLGFKTRSRDCNMES